VDFSHELSILLSIVVPFWTTNSSQSRPSQITL
jgi:hypothetical protein